MIFEGKKNYTNIFIHINYAFCFISLFFQPSLNINRDVSRTIILQTTPCIYKRSNCKHTNKSQFESSFYNHIKMIIQCNIFASDSMSNKTMKCLVETSNSSQKSTQFVDTYSKPLFVGCLKDFISGQKWFFEFNKDDRKQSYRCVRAGPSYISRVKRYITGRK